MSLSRTVLSLSTRRTSLILNSMHSSLLHSRKFNSCSCKIAICNFQSLGGQRIRTNLVRHLSEVKKQGKKSSPISWISLLVFLAAGGGVVWYVRYLKEEKEKLKEKERTKSLGTVALGGPFELIDVDGNLKTDKDFLGQWIILYFGFTHCPDVCPDQLDKLAEVLNIVDSHKDLPKVQPLFITVDPARDDTKAIKEYLKDFHPRIIGLTGSEEQIKKATRAYRVYFSIGPKDEDEDYIVDHTVIMYLVKPDGTFSDYFGQNKSIEEIASTIANRMMVYKYKKT